MAVSEVRLLRCYDYHLRRHDAADSAAMPPLPYTLFAATPFRHAADVARCRFFDAAVLHIDDFVATPLSMLAHTPARCRHAAYEPYYAE